MISIDDIQAKTFFKALKDNSDNLIDDKDLTRLKDEYFLLRNDGVEKNNLEIYKRLALLEHKLAVLNLGQTIYQDLPLNDKRRSEVNKCIRDCGFKLKITEKTTAKDIDNQFRSFIGSIKNSIEINKSNLISPKKQSNDFNFAKVIVSFEMVLDKSISEDISLAKFIAYEKMANKVIEKRSKK